MNEEDANTYHIHPFDLTKVWPHADYPLIEVGIMELNKNPENFFADVEQAAFAPTNIVPGIGYSPDRMLQGRLFSYGDTQRYRLGVNHYQIPVNASKCPFHAYHRDGAMRIDGNYGGATSYEPNRHGEWQQQPDYSDPPLAINGDAQKFNFREDDDDYYSQPGILFRMFSQEEKRRLFENTARSLGLASKEVRNRHVANCTKVDPAYGERVEKALEEYLQRARNPLSLSTVS